MIQLYLPCLFLVMLSWIVFWMSPENGGDRLTVGITCILTIVFLLGYVNGMLPKVCLRTSIGHLLFNSYQERTAGVFTRTFLAMLSQSARKVHIFKCHMNSFDHFLAFNLSDLIRIGRKCLLSFIEERLVSNEARWLLRNKPVKLDK